ncbi:MAG: glycosyltransferase family 2 protein [Actinobacteria bacterium]|nr:glycosyltransferase family 2 protein [Actinomycetota bacterium]
MSQVDVAIVTYGGGTDIPACLEALRAQTAPIGRVLIVDNSLDDSVASIAAGVDVEYVHNATNVGYAAAMNQAYALTTAPYLLSLNADCELHADYVRACVAALESDGRSAAVTGTLRLPHGAIDSTGIELTPARQAVDRDRMRASPSPSSEPFGVSGAAALWRRAALDSVGPDPWWAWLFVYWDDVEIAWRLRRRGWTFGHTPAATATHRRGSDTADADFVEAQSLRNRLATVSRHEGLRGLVAPRPLALNLATVARLALRHPAALRRANPVVAVRTGLEERTRDMSLGPAF